MTATVASPVLILMILGLAAPALAAEGDAIQGPPGQGTTRYVVPDSSVERPDDIGRRAHTTYGIAVPAQRITGPGQTLPPRHPD